MTQQTSKYPNARVIAECTFMEILDAKTGKLLGIKNVRHYEVSNGKMRRVKLGSK